MGSSARKKKTKKADFAKPKLKVGKARPKNTNFTDTSFTSKAIHVPTQSLRLAAPSASAQLTNHLSHLSSASSTNSGSGSGSSNRAEHLAALSTLLSSSFSSPTTLPISTSKLLTVLNPLILDSDNRVRALLPKLYALLPPKEVSPETERLLPYLRAGLAHLSKDIRATSLDLWVWALGAFGEEVVSCPGGWIKTLKTFFTVLGWEIVLPEQGGKEGTVKQQQQQQMQNGWTNKGVTRHGGTVLEAKILNTLALFLRCGLLRPEVSGDGAETSHWCFPLWNVEAHLLPQRPNPYGWLNLFGEPRDEEGDVYLDVEERVRVCSRLGYLEGLAVGVGGLKREGGETGRAAGAIAKVLKEVRDPEA